MAPLTCTSILFFTCIFQLIGKINFTNAQHLADSQNLASQNLPNHNKKDSSLRDQAETLSIKQQPTQLKYRNIKNSFQFNQLFAQKIQSIPEATIHDATYLSNKRQICQKNQPCQFYYYIIEPRLKSNIFPQPYSPKPQSVKQKSQQEIKNIFLIAGMHGNQYLGPLSLLYGVQHLYSASRLIIFPLANPSGFLRRLRNTYPTNIDPNRDYPIETYTLCYQTSATLIIDFIYRKYQIDLTLAMHNGGTQIGWNWGTKRENKNSHTPDYEIQKDIGKMFKYYGGSNKKLNMKKFQIGTMDESVYPVSGSFDDWAYAGSWYLPSHRSNFQGKFKNCTYKQYPRNMTKGLVFLFQLGPVQVPESQFGSAQGIDSDPDSTAPENGYLSRTIRILKGVLNIMNPRILFSFTQDKVIMKLDGCKNGIVSNLKISNAAMQDIFSKSQKLQNKEQKILQVYLQMKQGQSQQIQGNINDFQPEAVNLQLAKNITNRKYMKESQEDINKIKKNQDSKNKNQHFEDEILFQEKLVSVSYDLECDTDWIGLGKTIFAKKRSFYIQQTSKLSLFSKERQSHAHSFQSFYYLDNLQQAQISARFLKQNPSSIFANPLKCPFSHGNRFNIKDSIMIVILTIIIIIFSCFFIKKVFQKVMNGLRSRAVRIKTEEYQKKEINFNDNSQTSNYFDNSLSQQQDEEEETEYQGQGQRKQYKIQYGNSPKTYKN